MTTAEGVSADRDRPTLLLITADLFLGSRIHGLGEAAGYEVKAGVSERALDDRPDGLLPDRVIADLACRRLNLEVLCSRFGVEAPARIAAYAQHVRVDLLRAARAAGLTAVFTRSQLEVELPRWLS
jgi:hypothetical protein